MSSEPLPELQRYHEVMTSQEVAEVLVLSHQVAVKHMASGRLPGFKVGGVWRVRRADIQAVMEGRWHPSRAIEDAEHDDTEQ